MQAKPQLCVGLDTGNSRTRCVICVLEGEHLRYLSHGLSYSAGWVRRRIADQDAVAESLHATIVAAERGVHVSLEAATRGVGGIDVKGAQSRGIYEFGRPHELSTDDLAVA